MDNELKPCPFCGAMPSTSNFFDGFFWYWRILCTMCNVMMERASVKKEPIDKIAAFWNRRNDDEK